MACHVFLIPWAIGCEKTYPWLALSNLGLYNAAVIHSCGVFLLISRVYADHYLLHQSDLRDRFAN